MASVRSFLYHSNLIQTKCVTLRNANWTELVLFICSGADWTAWWPFTQQITTIPNNTICTRSGCDHRTELLSTAERQLFLIFSYVRLVSTHCDQQEICGTASCNRTPGYCLLLALQAALLWQQLCRLICTCIWVEIAQWATDTTEGGGESSHCLQAFAMWQQSSYPISTILNLSGLNRLQLESDNSPPLNARVKKNLYPLHCTLFYTGCPFYLCPEHGSLSYRKPPFAGAFGDSCLAEEHG